MYHMLCLRIALHSMFWGWFLTVRVPHSVRFASGVGSTVCCACICALIEEPVYGRDLLQAVDVSVSLGHVARWRSVCIWRGRVVM